MLHIFCSVSFIHMCVYVFFRFVTRHANNERHTLKMFSNKINTKMFECVFAFILYINIFSLTKWYDKTDIRSESAWVNYAVAFIKSSTYSIGCLYKIQKLKPQMEKILSLETFLVFQLNLCLRAFVSVLALLHGVYSTFMYESLSLRSFFLSSSIFFSLSVFEFCFY